MAQRLTKASFQLTPEQYAYLAERARRSGVGSISAVVRMLIAAEMAREVEAERCPTCGQEWRR